MSYRWPGNVRELRNVIETMVALARTECLDVDLLPPEMRSAAPELPVLAAASRILTLQEAEKLLITRALQAADGNRVEAAKALGIGERTLYRKIKEYGLA